MEFDTQVRATVTWPYVFVIVPRLPSTGGIMLLDISELSIGWVNPRVGLGCVGSGWIEFFQFFMGWLGWVEC